MKNVRVPPNSNRILTQRPYEKRPFIIIADVVQHEF